ncbi:MAG TPA: aminodeoxychorismate synthase component I [Rhodothermales bacterium]|nr:aminodeoxychorismate synthase component I [Rhodothermales bacterium]
MTSQLPPLEPGTVLLETGRPDDENQQSLLFRDPVEVLSTHRSTEVPALLRELDIRLDRGFHVAGFLDYECGYAFEAFPEYTDESRPIAWFGVYRQPELWPVFERDRWDPALAARVSAATFSWSRDAYESAFRRTKSHLYEGDVYQINLTGKFRFEYEGSIGHLYRLLKQRQGVAFNALIVTDHDTIISCSPELFFRREGRRIWTRPMKGTAARGRTIEEDHQLADALAADPKSQAENLMIVDLLRNDLSRVAELGSVKVSELFTTERYETVIQLTSTVEAVLRDDVRFADLFAALFPCGSVTGAPKIRAMKIIRDIETEARGVYTGTIGYAAPDGKATFSVGIRTLRLADGRGEMGSGGGIVWDSNADDEFDECLLKGRFLTADEPTFQLLETMLCDGEVKRLDRHVDRLLTSADFFGFSVDPRIVLKKIEDAVEAHGRSGRVKMRLLLAKDGTVQIEATSINGVVTDPTIVLSDDRVDSLDRFLYHKTTRRPLYERELDRAMAAGHLEVVFANERGEITEGARSNVYCRKSGRLLTPPVSSGLLKGTIRQELVDQGEVEERILYPDDLFDADAVFISNAILGFVEVTPIRS